MLFLKFSIDILAFCMPVSLMQKILAIAATILRNEPTNPNTAFAIFLANSHRVSIRTKISLKNVFGKKIENRLDHLLVEFGELLQEFHERFPQFSSIHCHITIIPHKQGDDQEHHIDAHFRDDAQYVDELHDDCPHTRDHGRHLEQQL